MKKKCTGCRQSLDLLKFKVSDRTKDGLQTKCQDCAEKAKLKQRERYSDPEYQQKKLESLREKYHNDPSYKEKLNKKRSVNQLKQYHNDPSYKEKLNKKRSVNQLKQYHDDPKTKVHVNISSQIRQSLKKGKQGMSWELIVGYSLEELMSHLESLFLEGMSWENYGDWHIDHRTPKSWFNFETLEDPDFKKCWSLKNLKPMWGSENISKGNKFSD
jgi:hypothetical protein